MISKKQWLLITVPMLIIIVGFFAVFLIPAKPSHDLSGGSEEPGGGSTAASSTATGPTYATIDNLIAVDAPFKNATVSSPLVISGTARGTWYFEASAPIELRDANGKVIAQGHVDAQGDWMTEDFVPFKTTLTFATQPAGSKGTLVLKNDNPSGDPARQKELLIPVAF